MTDQRSRNFKELLQETEVKTSRSFSVGLNGTSFAAGPTASAPEPLGSKSSKASRFSKHRSSKVSSGADDNSPQGPSDWRAVFNTSSPSQKRRSQASAGSQRPRLNSPGPKGDQGTSPTSQQGLSVGWA